MSVVWLALAIVRQSSSSVATVGSVSGTGSSGVGGLIGHNGLSSGATISSSVATVGAISGMDYVGGLLGWGGGATISILCSGYQ